MLIFMLLTVVLLTELLIRKLVALGFKVISFHDLSELLTSPLPNFL